ncbi:glycosyltransferase family 2 protein [Tamilnaduibacter salinus]|uniref:glycosyltransferase n=1 Tax=Tamilnaduibacter salinus TaxID=1484056 RepID=UPI00117DA774|nr:hypothetical protein [Tamilnaduibacter salinus]
MKKSKKRKKLAIGGIYKSRKNPTWVEKYWLLETRSNNCHQKDFVGGCIIIRKAHFILVGGFLEELSSGEDTQLTYDLRKNGITATVDASMAVIHLGNPDSLKEFIRRQSWHAESYKRHFRKNLRDPVFMLMTAYAVFGAIFVALTPFGWSFTATALLTQIPPALLSVKRVYRAGFKPRFSDAIKILALDNIYLIGRLKGLFTIPRH